MNELAKLAKYFLTNQVDKPNAMKAKGNALLKSKPKKRNTFKFNINAAMSSKFSKTVQQFKTHTPQNAEDQVNSL